MEPLFYQLSGRHGPADAARADTLPAGQSPWNLIGAFLQPHQPIDDGCGPGPLEPLPGA